MVGSPLQQAGCKAQPLPHHVCCYTGADRTKQNSTKIEPKQAEKKDPDKNSQVNDKRAKNYKSIKRNRIIKEKKNTKNTKGNKK